jgi:hypothetical protein
MATPAAEVGEPRLQGRREGWCGAGIGCCAHAAAEVGGTSATGTVCGSCGAGIRGCAHADRRGGEHLGYGIGGPKGFLVKACLGGNAGLVAGGLSWLWKEGSSPMG